MLIRKNVNAEVLAHILDGYLQATSSLSDKLFNMPVASRLEENIFLRDLEMLILKSFAHEFMENGATAAPTWEQFKSFLSAYLGPFPSWKELDLSPEEFKKKVDSVEPSLKCLLQGLMEIIKGKLCHQGASDIWQIVDATLPFLEGPVALIVPNIIENGDAIIKSAETRVSYCIRIMNNAALYMRQDDAVLDIRAELDRIFGPE